MNRETILKQWDYWRKQIADGNTASAPRDWFESILDYYEEQIQDDKQSGGNQ
ncbi:MAG TPA: hypothetical protein VMW91_07975 [Desulfosporosinus sp.]|nr:hypothetical protein [Desulfosporosinus sp.]HUV26577.1 hypothetical protein [Anaerolineales bacterium]